MTVDPRRFRTIGTAGHVDHGKSTLVQALTGMNPDRLQEELDRQMTIDLGFAWMELDDGTEVGIVDVPGHRDFIENMLAGVVAIDAVLLVIAADEGIMPQTLEHLAILNLLKIPHGIAVLSKSDLVDKEWLTLVEEEIGDLLANTEFAGSKIIPVSSTKGTGLDELRSEISRLLESSPVKEDRGKPRLSIDRVFSLTGFGTVVTGTLVGGKLQVGQEIVVLPEGAKSRIRNLQSHKNQRDEVMPGGRVAINLSGIAKSDLKRGDTVVLPEQWEPTTLLHARFDALPDLSAPIKHDQEVKLFHGAKQSMARIRLIGKDEIKPGEQVWIQLILGEPFVVERGDSFILRRPSPGSTLGGGVVVDPHPKSLYRQKDPSPIERMEKMLSSDPGDVLLDAINREGPTRLIDLQLNIPESDLKSETEDLLHSGNLVVLGSGDLNESSYLMSTATWEDLKSRAESVLSAYHAKYPLRVGMAMQEFKTRMNLDPKWASDWLDFAVEGSLLNRNQSFFSLLGHSPTFTRQQRSSMESIVKTFHSKPFNTPSRKEILNEIDEELLNHLLWDGQIVSLGGDVLLAGDVYQQAVARIKDYINENQTITIAQVRDMFETSRKYALALMEHLDAVGVTKREGDARKLVS